MELNLRKSLLLAALAALLLSVLVVGVPSEPTSKPHVKNVILMIGDGMGFEILTLARYYSLSILRSDLYIFEVARLGSTGYVTTHSLDYLVTDSAAAGTALATGFKTNNGMISVLPNGMSLETVLERAQKLGKSVGLVTTTRITHATPAAFASHVVSRGMENEIAVQLIYHKVNVLLGGGLRHFIPKEVPGSKRKDSRDLIKEAKALGYLIVRNRTQLLAVDPSRTRLLLGLFSLSHMAYEIDRKGTGQPSLAEMTKKAIEILSRDKDGFFLMVEGGRIDHACHANDAAAAIMDTLAFDEAVKVALDFAKRDGETLVIITADHDTGAPTLTYSRRVKPKAGNLAFLAKVNASFELIIDELKGGELTVERVKEVVKRYTGLSITDGEARTLIAAMKEPGKAAWPPCFYEQPQNTLGRLISAEVHVVSWATGGHTATLVPVIAYGPTSAKFGRLLDNTDIAKLIFEALGG